MNRMTLDFPAHDPTHHAFYENPSGKQAHLPYLEIKPRENGDGGNNMPAFIPWKQKTGF